jgi:hypothetical protein
VRAHKATVGLPPGDGHGPLGDATFVQLTPSGEVKTFMASEAGAPCRPKTGGVPIIIKVVGTVIGEHWLHPEEASKQIREMNSPRPVRKEVGLRRSDMLTPY